MTAMACPGELQLARALTVGAEPALVAHLAGCASCRATWDATQAAIGLTRELPIALPSAARREEVRTAVLAAAARVPHRPARRAWLGLTIACAAAAVAVGYVAISRTAAPQRVARNAHGTVHPQPGARYVTSAPGRDELVWLTDGTVDVEVEPLPAGERFRVVVGGAEVEVRGTAFTVTARDAQLIGVAVAHGRVDVRPVAGTSILLGAGQSWHATGAGAATPGVPPSLTTASTSATTPRQEAATPAALAAPLRHQAPHPAAAPATAVSREHTAVTTGPSRTPEPGRASPGSPDPRTGAERSYDQAWQALRANQFAQAASGFAGVLLLSPDSPLVEDASFWHAVALARGKRSAEATSAFRDFLDGYAHSARAGQASAMLGWILLDAGDYVEAARRFSAATGDANPEARRSAMAGLDALAARKH